LKLQIFRRGKHTKDDGIKENTQGSLEEQMVHNRRTFQVITEIREENIENNVI
jgi:hypothetical protein